MNWYNRQGKQAKSLNEQVRDLGLVNLDTIKSHADDLKGLLRKSSKFEAWMVDKIATARNDLHDVRMHLMQEEE